MMNRRQLLGAGAAGAALVSSRAWGKTANMGLPEAAVMDSAATQVTPRPASGPDYNPVVTLNGWTLPHRMNNGVKEFHLVAEPVERELAEGMTAHLWEICAEVGDALSDGSLKLAEPVAELNPLDDLGQSVLAVEFAPLLLRRHHQPERHGQPGLAAEASLGAFCAVPDGRKGALDRI